ncbi:sperm microtubule associated protein 2 like [Anarhichas minor]|uniref:sperm microtubule associated protein 2 like n=1 Tax=Anarhichas minor TaxID=65739 RepID=UPI003F7357BF
MSGEPGIESRFGPSNRLIACPPPLGPEALRSYLELICVFWGIVCFLCRVLELAQHKTSKTVWATTPCGKLSWGSQEPIWPLSAPALGAVPSARIQYLARHKRDFSAREDQRRSDSSRDQLRLRSIFFKFIDLQPELQQQHHAPTVRPLLQKEEASFSRKTRRPSSEASRYEHIVRLSTPRTRSCSSQEAGPPHTPQCDNNCPVWHVDPNMKAAVITPRLLQLSKPKLSHPDFQSNRESVASIVSFASKTARISQRLVQLSLPRLKQSNVCLELGRPAEPIWTVSKAARRATASARVEMLATPKHLSEDYVAPREPEWSRNYVPSS